MGRVESLKPQRAAVRDSSEKSLLPYGSFSGSEKV